MLAVEDPTDPWEEGLLRSPYDRYARLRDAGPVVKNTKYGFWSMYRHEDVAAAMSDWETYCSSRGVGITDTAKEQAWRKPSLLLNADPPQHTEMRKIVNGIFSPRAIRNLRAQFEATAEEHVAALGDRSEIDGATEIAEAFPIAVFPDSVGVRPDGRDNLLLYGLMAFNSEGPKNEIYHDAFRHADTVHAWIEEACKRENLADTGFGADIWAAHDQGLITAEQAALLVRSVLTAGLDTTIALIGNTLLALARNPRYWRDLKEDPALVKGAIEETMRHDAPVQLFFRTTTQAVEVHGVEIPADAKVLLSLASANRDPRRWGEDADTFDPHRNTAGHMGFGVGIHRCLGQMIARLEAEVILTRLVREYESIELAGEPELRLNNVVRSRKKIPLKLHKSK
ncbi:cytochrome P450 [Nocardiopsis sp. ATB16-24]|uniref:cytochrome P450 n=1 Tax=Nocardiopsis sp. ATB16-24 TaxID=3019555 RepID=UPI002553B671|nr:cytochrome P450 [Nocardiopsis sp. ATB16-24]